MGEHSTYGDSITENAEGNCPEVKVKLGGVDVGCLINTGAEVSTITQSFHKEFVDFAESRPRKLAPSSEVVVLHALQMYKLPIMSQEIVAEIVNDKGHVRLVGSGPTLVQACSIRPLEGSVKPAEGFPHNALIERVEANLAELPCGVTVGAAVVTADKKERVPISLADFSSKDVYLHPRTPAAAISTFHMKLTLQFVRIDESHVCVRRAGSDDEVKYNSKTDAILSRMDVGDLT